MLTKAGARKCCPSPSLRLGFSVCLGLLTSSLMLVSCTPTAPPPQPSPALPPPVQQPVVEPLTLGLALPSAVKTARVQAYLNKLRGQGASLGQQGIWIQTQDTLLANHQGTVPLPAASLTKVATSLVALARLGPDHRFITQISHTGSIQNGVLQGDLVVAGSADPFFVWEDAIALANQLRQKGIRKITGNLVLVGPFYMNFQTDSMAAGTALRQGLDARLWPSEAEAQFRTLPPNTPRPQVEIVGAIQTATAPPQKVQPLLRHSSLPLAELLKKMNQYSNNDMADMIANVVGGAPEVASQAAKIAAVPPAEIQLINGSGLGEENRISPRAVCAMYHAIARLLHPQQLTIADIFAVTGEQEGILNQRPLPAGWVVKSGTLDRVSALAGAWPTKNQGVVWFVILNGGGDVDQFRAEQENLLQQLQQDYGIAPSPPDLLRPNPKRAKNRPINEFDAPLTVESAMGV